ncbi:MAG: hypothetical protein ACKVVT_14040 [Dehalococcoidia bacterium]
MTTTAEIQSAIASLSPSEAAGLLAWFEEWLAAQVDAALERDVATGRFDQIIAKALEDDEAGLSTPLV